MSDLFSPKAVTPNPARRAAQPDGYELGDGAGECERSFMRTTIELPEELVRQAEARATREGRSLKDLVTEGLRRVLGLETTRAADAPRRVVSFPLVPETAHSPVISLEDVNRALADEDAERYARFVRR